MIYRWAVTCALLLAVVAGAAPPQAPLPPQAPAIPDEPVVVAPKITPKIAVPAKIEAPAAPTKVAWKQGSFHPNHNCPVCGRSEYIQSGQNRDGTHNHTCKFDGTIWRH